MRITPFRLAGLVGVLLATAPAAPAATPKEIDRALKGGTDALKAPYARGAAPSTTHGIGPTCLAGLALLEAGTPADDAAVKAITALVRNASYKQNATYQVALCLMYLDRFRDPADVPLIQMLAARLIVGQTRAGGWDYTCVPAVPAADEAALRAAFKKVELAAGGAADPPTLHPVVREYGKSLMATRTPTDDGDNSNTQFALLAVWMARKHGAPVDAALAAVEARFVASQDARTGNWPYSGSGSSGSPAMYCAGLLGLSTGVARREERRLKSDAPAPKPDKPMPDKPADLFHNPPAGKEPPKKARPADPSDRAVQLAFAGLGLTFADQIRTRKLLAADGSHGHGDLYFLWSMERVGVVYGVDKIGGVDWYELGTTLIVRSQASDGGWTVGGYTPEVNTAFAVLFLCRSNLARDLSGKVQNDPSSTEMRAGTAPAATDLLPDRPAAPAAAAPALTLPNPTGDAGIAQATTMLKAAGGDWATLLAAARDTKGATNTRALVLAATHAAGDRKAAAREALAERLCRMTPATLRAMLKADEAELRRGAALACAMKDDKQHVPDLIEVLADADGSVVRAAKAALNSLTGKDFGPPAVATAEQKRAAAAAWADWYAKEKK